MDEEKESERERGRQDMQWLLDAFPSISLEEIASAYSASNCDLNDTAHSLTAIAIPPSSSCNKDDHPHPNLALKDKTLYTSKLNYNKKKKNKKISVCTGSVSSVVGNAARRKKQDQERQLEEFLYAIMGDGWQIEMDLIRDVLSQCGYDVEKSLNRLLEMAATSSEIHYKDLAAGESSVNCSNEKDGLVQISFRMMSESFPERDPDELLIACESNLEQLKLSFPDLSESVLNEILESVDFSYSEARNILIEAGMESRHVGAEDKSELPRQLLHSLFNIKTSNEKIPSNMDSVKALRLKKKSKKMVVNTSMGNLSDSTKTGVADGEEDEYELLRKTASQHWGTMRSYFQEAAAAYSMGQRARAGYLSAEGNHYKQLAREADEKASKQIFDVKNKDMHNDVTLDLHSQHVKDAIRILKLHIQSLAAISSIHSLKVITGCGSHGTGHGRLKRAVTQLLEKEGIDWTNENAGVIVIKIKNVDPENLSFVNADTDA